MSHEEPEAQGDGVNATVRTRLDPNERPEYLYQVSMELPPTFSEGGTENVVERLSNYSPALAVAAPSSVDWDVVTIAVSARDLAEAALRAMQVVAEVVPVPPTALTVIGWAHVDARELPKRKVQA